MRSENFGDGELLVLQVRIAGAGRPSPCVTLGSCFDLFKGSKVTDVLETLGRNKNKKKKRKKPIANFTMQCRNKEFSPTILLVGHRDICWKVGKSLNRILASSSGTLRRMLGDPSWFLEHFFTYFYQTEFIKKARKLKIVGKWLEGLWNWTSFETLGENLSCCPTPHCSVVLPSILAFRAGPRPVTALPNHGDGGWPIQRGSSRQTFFNIFNYTYV